MSHQFNSPYNEKGRIWMTPLSATLVTCLSLCRLNYLQFLYLDPFFFKFPFGRRCCYKYRLRRLFGFFDPLAYRSGYRLVEFPPIHQPKRTCFYLIFKSFQLSWCNWPKWIVDLESRAPQIETSNKIGGFRKYFHDPKKRWSSLDLWIDNLLWSIFWLNVVARRPWKWSTMATTWAKQLDPVQPVFFFSPLQILVYSSLDSFIIIRFHFLYFFVASRSKDVMAASVRKERTSLVRYYQDSLTIWIIITFVVKFDS